MKKMLTLTAIFAVIATLGLSHFAAAQAPQPPVQQTKAPIPFMIVDLVALMESHPMRQTEFKSFEKEVSDAQQVIIARRNQIKQEHEAAMKSYAPSSPQFQQAAEKATKETMASEAEARILSEKFKKRDLEIQYKYFREIRQCISDFAKHNNVGVVFLYRSPENAVNILNKQQQLISATNKAAPTQLSEEDIRELEIGLTQGNNPIYVNSTYDMTENIRQMILRNYPAMATAPNGQPNAR
ncbi:MAG: hypothetical protein LBQ54_15550 [Planctomycetaceae bacterium]|jgi:Skp family chaperone for outer membrane proteins|nr:hypothetical protein [Planctomycetaceae bacterium]